MKFKFRARDLKTGSISYFDFSTCLPIYGTDEFEVSQLVGVDREGQEIYEGDVVYLPKNDFGRVRDGKVHGLLDDYNLAFCQIHGVVQKIC